MSFAAGPEPKLDDDCAERGPFAINPSLDPSRMRAAFRRTGRLHIQDFLTTEGAALLHSHLRARNDWLLVINQQERLFELDRAAQDALSKEQREQLETAIAKSARDGFQFCFETVRVADADADRAADGNLLATFARFMSSDPVLEFMRTVTGRPDMNFADAQATAYGPRHFLTAHDDDVEGKHRAAAYVLNLTPDWRVDWGGLLMFHSPNGHVQEALAPRFNALNLFAVPQLHSVSYVTPFVPNRRYAVTGWLRTSSKP
jgi:Rps23 Pro-64 3,4-dihydroxylase Tpa1-like proline 4-hydroxylase